MLMRDKAIVIRGLVLFVAFLVIPFDDRVLAQNRRPSQILKQVEEERRALAKSFEQAVRAGEAQSYEWDRRLEKLRRQTMDLTSGFKAGDWQGDELLSLAALYQFTEQFAPAADALQAYRLSTPQTRMSRNIDLRSSIVRALLESGQLEKAEEALNQAYRENDGNPQLLILLVGLHRDLVIALRDRGHLEKAAEEARDGYFLSTGVKAGPAFLARFREQVFRDRLSLAALHVAINENLNRAKSASDFNRRVLAEDLSDQPGLREFYQAELTGARLIGRIAPDLVVDRWLDGKSMTLGELRGKVVLLDFTAMWCTPCVADFSYLSEFGQKYSDRGLEIIGVTRFYGRSDVAEDLSKTEELKGLEAYKRKHKLLFPLAIAKMDDVTNEERFDSRAMPTIILIDRRGKIRQIKRAIGEYRKLEHQIVQLIDERP